MAFKVKVGGESFDVLRKAGCYYVDKSELIYDLVNSENTVSLKNPRHEHDGEFL